MPVIIAIQVAKRREKVLGEVQLEIRGRHETDHCTVKIC